MYAVMLERYEPSREGERSFELCSESTEGLLVKWLSELLFYFETESLIFSDFSAVVSGASGERKLSARASFCHYDEKKHGYAELIKAVTYHNLEIKREKGIYVVEVIFDV
jgi:SHS2 domain-containing protein